VATTLTPLATPYGTQIIHYYGEFIGNGPMARMAIEWASPRFPSFAFFELCVPAVITVAVVVFALIKRQRPTGVLIAAAAVTAGAAAVETGSIVWFGMTAAVLLADTMKTWLPRQPKKRGFSLLLAWTAIVLGSVVVTQLVERSDASYESQLPGRVMTTAASYAASHGCALILADNLSSSALLWHDPWLDGRIGFDARLEQYSHAALNRWLAFTEVTGRDWTAANAGYNLLIGVSSYANLLVRRLERFPKSAVLARQSAGIAVVNTPTAAAGNNCGRGTRGRT
jgi:hypothetical protein